uniref:Ribonuclease H-like domain-containing protein n=1 Tax=Tanacetum cinerariifolium TaxID=118510 RepID=A0A699HZV4_TANCI|nr:ribonuclease H-like domain-containing protein [Tanacetum cinerariifolium]
MVTRAKAGILKTLERMNCHVTTNSSLPRSYVHVALLDEYNALISNGMWVLVSLLANISVVRSIYNISYLLIYVDDIILTTSSSAFLHRVIVLLHGEFAMTNLGSLNYFLGISAQRSSVDTRSKLGADGDPISDPTLYRSLAGFYLSQSTYAQEILKRTHMQKCNPCRTPIDTRSKLGVNSDLVSDPTLYRSLAGAIQYLTFTRPDISYAVQHLTGYTNIDWAGFSVTRRSTSGYCVFLSDNLLSWSAKQHVTLSRTSAEVEYRGVANVAAETVWVRNLLHDLHAPLFIATFVYFDNVSVVYLSANPVQHQRTKHIEIHIHFIRDFVASGQVRVFYVLRGFSMLIYLFTKGLPSALFLEFRSSLNVRRPPAQSVRVY